MMAHESSSLAHPGASQPAAGSTAAQQVNQERPQRCGCPSRWGVVRSYTRFLHRARYVVVVIAVVLVVLGAIEGPALISRTSNQFTAPPESLSARTAVIVDQLFPSLATQTQLVLYVERLPNTSSVLNPTLKEFTLALNHSLATDVRTASLLRSFESYYTTLELGLPPAFAAPFLSIDSTGGHPSTIIRIVVNTWITTRAATSFANAALDIVADMQQEYPKAGNSHLLGVPVFLLSIVKSAEHDMGIMDGIAMPLALIVLAYVLRTVRLMILPVLALATSGLVSFGIMSVVADHIHVISITPSLMMSLLVAINIDYTLFLAARYRTALLEQLAEQGKQPSLRCAAYLDSYKAVESMLYTAGHTITVSGLTLTLCFLGLTMFKVQMLQTLGVGCATAILCTLLTAVTQTAVLLLLFPRFFAACVEPAHCCRRRIRVPCWANSSSSSSPKASQQSAEGSDPPATADSSTHTRIVTAKLATEAAPLLGNGAASDAAAADHDARTAAVAEHEARRLRGTCWFRLASRLVQCPFNIIAIVVVCGAVLPIALHAFGYPKSDSLNLDMPRNSPTTAALAKMSNQFGIGVMEPYKLVMVPPKGVPMLSDAYFHKAQDVVFDMASALPFTSTKNFSGLVYVGTEDFNVSAILVNDCLNASLSGYTSGICKGLRQSVATFANEALTASYVQITLSIDPVGAHGDGWLAEMKRLMPLLGKKHGLTLYLTGVSFTIMDAIDWVNGEFPGMVIVTVCVTLVFVGVAFRSVLVPLRSVITIGITILFVFGFAALTYVDGDMEWLPIPGLRSVNGIVWMLPVITFSVIVGIGLDYDIFLLVAIEDARRVKRFDNKSAIVAGVCQTGNVITSAGIIMGIAFGGLLFSQTPVLNFLSFYLVTAVLFDTFVIRSLVVPAMMSIVGDYNWWPRKPQPPKRSLF